MKVLGRSTSLIGAIAIALMDTRTCSSNAFVVVKTRHYTTASNRSKKNPIISSIDKINRGGALLNLGPAEAWSAYNDALEASPLIVKSLTASVILGSADLAGQAIEKARKEEAEKEPAINGDDGGGVDWARAIRFAIFGLVLQAPWNHFYYLLLDGQIPPTTEPFTPTNGIKVFIDQFVQAPVFTVLIFVFLGALEGKNTQAIQNQLKKDYKETIFANWKLWVPATVINIGFVPPLFRVLYLNCVFFFWSIYLSLVLNKDESDA